MTEHEASVILTAEVQHPEWPLFAEARKDAIQAFEKIGEYKDLAGHGKLM